MTDERLNLGVARLLGLLSDRLESFLEGDDTALETLGESIEQADFTAEEVQAAILVLGSLARTASPAAPAVLRAPGEQAHRILSAEERESLSTEAWGYLIDLRRRGSLSAEDFERTLDLLSGCGVRPVSVDLARDVATRVALKVDDPGEGLEARHGEFDLAH
ncbi:MAG: DUF494 domain-containing protein [Candidatus Eisenbacteria bacterium]|uniref:DUF494 domain-containing protein n=1 Tax=Eiseniibacteriota bacterium TaxID=2212470 RepID=A0A538SJG2_UNCEI|nr:MAG: DUF494 domain-containing protein [Candidatus Eisenbacteria bacterium]